jgi:hypothetical protein
MKSNGEEVSALGFSHTHAINVNTIIWLNSYWFYVIFPFAGLAARVQGGQLRNRRLIPSSVRDFCSSRKWAHPVSSLVTGGSDLLQGIKRLGRKADLDQVTRLRMSSAISSFPHLSSWCGKWHLLFPWGNSPQWARASWLSRLHDHTQTHHTLGSTPLDKWSAQRRDLDLTTHNTHKRQTSMPSVGFEPAIPESTRPQTHALDRADTGIGSYLVKDVFHTHVYIHIYGMGDKIIKYVSTDLFGNWMCHWLAPQAEV